MSATDYQVISCKDSDTASLQLRVVALIGAGWQPSGPLVMANGLVHQALIKGTPVGSGGSGEDYTLPAATDVTLGGVLQGDAVDDAVDDTDIVDQFNALLASLRASGAIAEA